MAYLDALQCLGDPTRRQVFERLRSGPASVAVLARGMPVSRPAVSQHLKVLKAAGLVGDRAAGTRRIYHVDPRGLEALREWLESFWDEALLEFKQEVESIPRRRGRKHP
jgi:DNA-binding transcriptional ArsR family regulator